MLFSENFTHFKKGSDNGRLNTGNYLSNHYMGSPTAPDSASLWTVARQGWRLMQTIFSHIWTGENPVKAVFPPPVRKRTPWKFFPASLREKPQALPFPCWSATHHDAPETIAKSQAITAPAMPIIPLTKNTASVTTAAADAPQDAKPLAV